MSKRLGLSDIGMEKVAEKFNTSSYKEFVDYYREQSDKPETWAHFDRIFSGLLSLHGTENDQVLRVGDIGGGSGTLSRVVASHGHRPVCVDLNEPLIEIGRKRAAEHGLDIEFHVASATEIPLNDQALDVCVVAELLEHIENWGACMDEVARVLKPGGIAFFSTTNVMCPKQNEFNLPLYSWFPTPLKRHFVEKAQTDRPDLANYATYPALHWFSFYSLKAALVKRGFTKFYDRYDLSLAREATGKKGLVYKITTSTPITRFLAYLTSAGSTIVAMKGN